MTEKLFEYKQMNEHSDHCWGLCCSKTVCDLVNFNNTWWATLHLKDIFILGYPLKHSYDSQQMSYAVAFEWMLEGCTHQDWLWDHLFWSSNAHFTAWIWVMSIIDNSNAFLFTIWFDKLKGIYREELKAYNDCHHPILGDSPKFIFFPK